MDITSPCPFELPQPDDGVQLLIDSPASANERKHRDTEPIGFEARSDPERTKDEWPSQHEIPDVLPVPARRPAVPPPGVTTHGGPWIRNGFESIQVNVNSNRLNIPGDAANEPSIAVDPTNRNRMVIGWRQFDSVSSDFRQAGYAYTEDGGQTWTFPGVIEPGVFRSDPVLDSDAEGKFYYYSLTTRSGSFDYDLFTSFDGGRTWPRSTPAFGGDKGWMVVDKVSSVGNGNIYAAWSGSPNFTRSTDGGQRFIEPVPSRAFFWGTIAVGPAGEVYVTSDGSVSKSLNAADPDQIPVFGAPVHADLGGRVRSFGTGPNPGGLLGQTWIAVDTSNGPTRGFVFRLASVEPRALSRDPLDVMFTRSENGGQTWSPPIRINDDTLDNGAWQWFGTMSVAPNGRIDVIWNDTRSSLDDFRFSELYYAYSDDAGHTWSKNIPVSLVFDTRLGIPSGQGKIGDYYDMVSDDEGVSIAYAATFNGEQDVYYLRIGPPADCNNNGVPDRDDVVIGGMPDCDGNSVPDECQSDWDRDGLIDKCDADLDGDGVNNEHDRCLYSRFGTLTDGQGAPRADTTGRCNVDLGDYWRFRNCMLNGRPGAPAPREACLNAFDTTGDEVVDLADFQGFQTSFSGSR